MLKWDSSIISLTGLSRETDETETMRRMLDNLDKENAALHDDVSHGKGSIAEVRQILDDVQEQNRELRAKHVEKDTAI